MSPEQVHNVAMDWAIWLDRIERGCLGYPKQTPEAGAGRGRSPNRPGPRVPDYPMRQDCANFDRAYGMLTREERRLVDVKYRCGGTTKAKAKALKMSVGNFRRRLENTLCTLSGLMRTM